MNDSQGLAELLHTAQVSVVAVTVDTHRHIEFDLIVRIVRLALSDIPRDTGSSKHDTSEGEVKSLGGGNNTNTLQTVDPNSVVRQHFLGLVNSVAELGGPLVDVVQETHGDILVDTTGSDVCGVEASSRDTLVEFLEGGGVVSAMLS